MKIRDYLIPIGAGVGLGCIVSFFFGRSTKSSKSKSKKEPEFNENTHFKRYTQRSRVILEGMKTLDPKILSSITNYNSYMNVMIAFLPQICVDMVWDFNLESFKTRMLYFKTDTEKYISSIKNSNMQMKVDIFNICDDIEDILGVQSLDFHKTILHFCVNEQDKTMDMLFANQLQNLISQFKGKFIVDIDEKSHPLHDLVKGFRKNIRSDFKSVKKYLKDYNIKFNDYWDYFISDTLVRDFGFNMYDFNMTYGQLEALDEQNNGERVIKLRAILDDLEACFQEVDKLDEELISSDLKTILDMD